MAGREGRRLILCPRVAGNQLSTLGGGDGAAVELGDHAEADDSDADGSLAHADGLCGNMRGLASLQQTAGDCTPVRKGAHSTAKIERQRSKRTVPP